MLICWCNCPDPQEAKDIATHLVQEKLAACVTISHGNTSIYQWEGKIEEDSESTLMIKTTSSNKEAIIKAVRAKHSYDVPEIIFTEVVDGDDEYLKWLRESCK